MELVFNNKKNIIFVIVFIFLVFLMVNFLELAGVQSSNSSQGLSSTQSSVKEKVQEKVNKPRQLKIRKGPSYIRGVDPSLVIHEEDQQEKEPGKITIKSSPSGLIRVQLNGPRN